MHARWALCARMVVAVACAGCASAEAQSVADLAITHAALFDAATGTVLRGRTVLVTDGIITSVTVDRAATHASRVIDARGRLLTPGFIDAHLHLCSMYAPACTDPYGEATHLVMRPDSIASYRRHLASLYLPYGVTAVRDVGSDEHAMPMLLAWMKRTPDAPDFYPSGAQLISPDPNHKPAPWQVEVATDAYGSSDATLVTDSTEYTVRFVRPRYRARISFAYTNHTRDAVSDNMCNYPAPPTLEKEVSPGRWVVAYSSILQLCKSEPPFRVAAGATYRGVLALLVAPKGSSFGPALKVDSIAGTYRLRWALRAGADPDNRSAPLIEAISPSFRLVER